jgi:hypothetical protein
VTASYGTGASFQQQCPAFPPGPPGYIPWDTSRNGPIPAEIVAHAKTLADDMSKPLGYSDTVYSGGVPIIVRVDAHTWTTDASGNAVEGCFHGADVWVPSGGASPASSGSSSSTGNTLLTASLLVGLVATGLGLLDRLTR